MASVKILAKINSKNVKKGVTLELNSYIKTIAHRMVEKISVNKNTQKSKQIKKIAESWKRLMRKMQGLVEQKKT